MQYTKWSWKYVPGTVNPPEKSRKPHKLQKRGKVQL